MAINPSSFVTRTALENFSIKAMNELTDYIADDIFEPVIVSKEQVKVYQYDTSQFRLSDSRKDSKAAADSIDYGVFATDRTCLLHKLKGEWDPNDSVQFDAVVADQEMDVAANVMQRLMLYKEYEAATAVTTTTNYPASLTATLAADATWIVNGGDPLTNVATARTAVRTYCAKEPNAAALSWTTFEKLRASPYFLDTMKYTKASVTAGEFKALLQTWLGVEQLFIGKALKNTNAEGSATQTLSDVWGDGILFYVKSGTTSPRSMRFGANYIFNQIYTHRWQDEERGAGRGRIQLLEMGLSYVLAPGAVVSSSDTDYAAGYYLSNVV